MELRNKETTEIVLALTRRADTINRGYLVSPHNGDVLIVHLQKVIYKTDYGPCGLYTFCLIPQKPGHRVEVRLFMILH